MKIISLKILNKLLQKIADWLFPPDKYLVCTPIDYRIGVYLGIIPLFIDLCKKENKKLVLINTYHSANKELPFCEFDCPILSTKSIKVYLLRIIILFFVISVKLYNKISYNLFKFFKLNIPQIAPHFRYFANPYDTQDDFSLLKILALQTKGGIKLNQSQISRGKEMIKKMGLSQNDWWICLHVREHGYAKSIKAGDRGTYTRNADIRSYIPAIRYITRKGGYVIRMGDPSMEPLPSMDRVIDYVHSSHYSDLADLFLISQCAGYIGTASGIMAMALIFQKKICSLNTMEFYEMVNIACFKHCYSIRENRMLSFQEMYKFTERVYSKNNPYLFIDNSPLEIKETVKEFLDFLENTHFQPKNPMLQKKAYELLISSEFVKEKLAKVISFDKNLISNIQNKKISSFYLENCWDNSPYLEELSKLYSGK